MDGKKMNQIIYYYDGKGAKFYIEKYKDQLKCAFYGMHQDWFCTAELIWDHENGYIEEMENDPPKLAGIDGSNWATPKLRLDFKDGRQSEILLYFDGFLHHYKEDWAENWCVCTGW